MAGIPAIDSATIDAAALDDLGEVSPDDVIAAVDGVLSQGAGAVSYEDLYLRWERQQWRTELIDFSQDAIDWREKLSDAQRGQLLWFMTQFFHAEERVAMELTPFVDAAPTPDQAIYLTTQVVDESRHCRFFDKFYREALGFDQPTIGDRLGAVKHLLSRGYRDLLGTDLSEVTDRMRAGDHSLETFVRGVVVYHLTIEGTVALSAQRYVLQFFRDAGIMPGFRSGFTAVARDESRHVNFGMKFLKETVGEHPEMVPVIHEQIARSVPAAARFFDPPPGEAGYGELLGFTMGDLYAYGFDTLQKRLHSIDVPPPFKWRRTVAA
ncbi:MAG TPA: ribonucleotide-diphosphate reductase subunit beta [Candidatus Dormibacteraeota bacterium]|jgi:ribonucleoside-diphosphate reductase beta chain|nr:ribonucleotide-diphosphate reductase subunit beta [Candidatus Dormibacteraeota bacterium]